MRSQKLRIAAIALAVPVLAAAIGVGCVGREFQDEPTPIPPIRSTAAAAAGVAPVKPPLPIACLDSNGDSKIDRRDLAPDALPDLNLDGNDDASDVAVLDDIDIPLIETCSGDAQFYIKPAAGGSPTCPARFAVIAGIVGASEAGLTDGQAGKGIGDLVVALQAKLMESGFDSAVTLSVPNMPTAKNQHAAMETWMELVLKGILDQVPCAHLVIVGHSHGATAALAVASWLENNGYTERIAYVAIIDRVTLRYEGDADSIPAARILHFYEKNATTEKCAPSQEGDLIDPPGMPTKHANVVETSVTERGLCHSDIDDDPAIRTEIVDVVNTVMNAKRP